MTSNDFKTEHEFKKEVHHLEKGVNLGGYGKTVQTDKL